MKLADFQLLDDEEEKDALLEKIREFNRNQSEYPRDKTVHQVFSDLAKQSPDALAVLDEDSSYCYDQVEKTSNQVAHLLLSLDLKEEEFVAVMLTQTFDIAAALLGILKAGGAYLPIDRDVPENRKKFILNDTKCRMMISDSDNFNLSNFPSTELHHLICLDEEKIPAANNELRAHTINSFSSEPPPFHGKPDSLAYIMYTSGTSGRPKGVLIEHRSILRLVINTNYISLSPDDRILQTGSLSFDASTFEFWGALLNGGAVGRPPEMSLLNPKEIGRLIRTFEITTMWLTSSLFNQFIDTEPKMFEPLQNLLIGGERLSPFHVKKARELFPDLRIVNGYGPTENTTFTACFPIEGEIKGDIPIGKPIANTEVLILDEQDGLCPIDIPGEICAAGDGLARAYLNDPQLTEKKFTPHPFKTSGKIYHTGDLGRWREDGNIEFIKRIDQQVKIRGYRIEPGEIENALEEQKGVKEAIVIPRNNENEEKFLTAYLTSDSKLEIDSIRQGLKRVLPDYMIPARFMILEQLPLTKNGKVDRHALPDPKPDASFSQKTEALEGEIEKKIAAIWKDLLKIKTVGATDNFFDLGGHSLKVTKLISAMEEKFGIEIPIVKVFQGPTIRELTKCLRETAKFGIQEADDDMILIGSDSTKHKIFAFPPVTGDILSYLQLAKCLTDCSFYAFNFIEAETRIKDFIKLILSTHPQEPFVLMGYSCGGNLAFHTAAALESQGRRVSDILMIDSARRLHPFHFPESEAKRVSEEFMNHENIRSYFTNEILKEKTRKKIKAYYKYNGENLDDRRVNANIHVILSKTTQMEYFDEKGNLIVQVDAWQDITSASFKKYQAFGTHNDMLYTPAVEKNAEVIKKILKEIFCQK